MTVERTSATWRIPEGRARRRDGAERAMLQSVEPGMTTPSSADRRPPPRAAQRGVRAPGGVRLPGLDLRQRERGGGAQNPGPRVIRAGDVANVDVSARLEGYFADTGGTTVVRRSRA